MKKTTRTVIERYDRGGSFMRPGARPRAGASLHSHSSCSRERLSFVPGVARQIPLVSRLFDRSVAQFGRAVGHPLDFDSVYWRPPASPAAVIASERRQIADRLDCEALVALTDHDTLEGPQRLRASGMSDVPLSVEWSVGVEETVFHLGVHGLPESRLAEAMRLLAPDASDRRTRDVAALLDWLGETRETFVILNHPLWDFAGVGPARHEVILLSFLRIHGHRIHGLELNGYRRWAENRRVLPLAEAFELPVVAAGDRHGHAPNAMINLTNATCFAELAGDLRAGRPTTCLIFPEYFDPFAARVFQGFREALRPGEDARRDPVTWGHRVFFTVDGVERSIASVWPRGGPWWLRGAIGFTRVLGSQSIRPLLRYTLSGEQAI